VLWTDLVTVNGTVVWEVTQTFVTGQRHLVTIDSSTVACKFLQPTDDNASGGNKSADKLVLVFMIWGQGVVVSCTKFLHQSYANHFHKYFAVTVATGDRDTSATVKTVTAYPGGHGRIHMNSGGAGAEVSHCLPTAVCFYIAL
jgi:hypothetical protein